MNIQLPKAEDVLKKPTPRASEYIKGWSDGVTYANSSAILKDFIEYLVDKHFVDDDVWQENDVIKEFLNEKENSRG